MREGQLAESMLIPEFRPAPIADGRSRPLSNSSKI